MPPGMEVGLGPGDFVFDGDPAPLERRAQPPPNFWPMSIVAKRLDGWRRHFARKYMLAQATLCWTGTKLPAKGTQRPPSFRHMSIVATVAHLSYCCRLCRGLYLRTKWQLDPSSRLATTDMGKIEGLCPFWGKAAGSTSNTMWPGPRSTSMSSFILIDPTAWPQYTNVTERQTDNGRIARGNRFTNGRPKTVLIYNP